MVDLGKQVALCVQSQKNFESIAPSFYNMVSRKSPALEMYSPF